MVAQSKVTGLARARSIEGIYIYNLSFGEYQKLTSKIRSGYYYISPKDQTIIANIDSRGLLVFNPERIYNPRLIDEWFRK